METLNFRGAFKKSDANLVILQAQLKVAPSTLDKLNILNSDSDFKFDFNQFPAGTNGAGTDHKISSISRLKYRIRLDYQRLVLIIRASLGYQS